MGLFDKAKRWLGLGEGEDEESVGEADTLPATGPPEVRRAARRGRGRADGRPALRDDAAPASTGPSLDDALAAREAGDKKESRRILREIDRGGGLRTLLRAAAAHEAGDEGELSELLGAIGREEPRWKLAWQAACAFDEPAETKRLLERAKALGAPGWAVAWARALSSDETEKREGLVALLFADAGLARTVAARDLAVPRAVVDTDAVARWAALSHGRDAIRRFGPKLVAEVLDRSSAGRST